MLDQIGANQCAPHERGELKLEAPGIWRADGRMGLGPVVADTALKVLLADAQDAAIAAAVVTNCSPRGLLSPYVERLAHAGAIGIALACVDPAFDRPCGSGALRRSRSAAIALPAGGQQASSRGWPRDGSRRLGSWGHGASLARQSDTPIIDIGAIKPPPIAAYASVDHSELGVVADLIVEAVSGPAIASAARRAMDAEHPCDRGDIIIAIRPEAHPGLAGQLVDYLQAIVGPAVPKAHPALAESLPPRASRRSDGARGVVLDPDLWSELQRLAIQIKAA